MATFKVKGVSSKASGFLNLFKLFISSLPEFRNYKVNCFGK